jgi:hypothetical protein
LCRPAIRADNRIGEELAFTGFPNGGTIQPVGSSVEDE